MMKIAIAQLNPIIGDRLSKPRQTKHRYESLA